MTIYNSGAWSHGEVERALWEGSFITLPKGNVLDFSVGKTDFTSSGTDFSSPRSGVHTGSEIGLRFTWDPASLRKTQSWAGCGPLVLL